MLTNTNHHLWCTAQKVNPIFALQYPGTCGLTLWQLRYPSVSRCTEMPAFGIWKGRLSSGNSSTGRKAFRILPFLACPLRGQGMQGRGARPEAPAKGAGDACCLGVSKP